VKRKRVVRTASYCADLDAIEAYVAHENFIVILIEDADTVTAINVVHARQQWPR
jgi:hypothetical protein